MKPPRTDFVATSLGVTLMGAMVLVTMLAMAPAIMQIFIKVPRSYNEGWNAFHAIHALDSREMLYFPRSSFITNNYPPLSFYFVGFLGQLLRDHVIAGRLIALSSLLIVAVNIYLIGRRSHVSVPAAMTGSLIFLGYITVHAYDYVAVNDPQWLAHAVMTSALVLLESYSPSWRRLVLIALLIAVGGFIKHNLIAIPVAIYCWLFLRNRLAARTFGIALGVSLGLFFLGAGIVYGNDFFTSLFATPRVLSFSLLAGSIEHRLTPAIVLLGLAILVLLANSRNEWLQLFGIYSALGMISALVMLLGEGIAENSTFDTVIALSLLSGHAVHYLPVQLGAQNQRVDLARVAITAVAASSFLIAAPRVFYDSQVYYGRANARAMEVAKDIAFLRDDAGAVGCDNLALCYWAGKVQHLEIFNTAQKIKNRLLTDADLMHYLDRRKINLIQLRGSGGDLARGLPDTTLRRLWADYEVARVGVTGTFLRRRVYSKTAPEPVTLTR